MAEKIERIFRDLFLIKVNLSDYSSKGNSTSIDQCSHLDNINKIKEIIVTHILIYECLFNNLLFSHVRQEKCGKVIEAENSRPGEVLQKNK